MEETAMGKSSKSSGRQEQSPPAKSQLQRLASFLQKRPCSAVPRVGSVGQRIRADRPNNVFRDRTKQDADACPGHFVRELSAWGGRAIFISRPPTAFCTHPPCRLDVRVPSPVAKHCRHLRTDLQGPPRLWVVGRRVGSRFLPGFSLWFPGRRPSPH